VKTQQKSIDKKINKTKQNQYHQIQNYYKRKLNKTQTKKSKYKIKLNKTQTNKNQN